VRRAGVATALFDALEGVAGGRAWWLVTTNDNLAALALYRGRGFVLEAILAGAVDVARRERKASIPVTAESGTGVHDELLFVRPLPANGTPPCDLRP
jgi:hypothetical protein